MTEKNLSGLEVAEVVIVKCNLIDTQYQQKFDVLCTFTLNKY